MKSLLAIVLFLPFFMNHLFAKETFNEQYNSLRCLIIEAEKKNKIQQTPCYPVSLNLEDSKINFGFIYTLNWNKKEWELSKDKNDKEASSDLLSKFKSKITFEVLEKKINSIANNYEELKGKKIIYILFQNKDSIEILTTSRENKNSNLSGMGENYKYKLVDNKWILKESESLDF